MIFLDTDVCVAYLRGNELIKAKFRKFEPEGFAVSSMTAAELLYGAEKSDDPDGSRMRVEEFLGSLNVVYGDENTVRTFGYVKAYLVRAGLAIPDADILVAAAALSRSCPLATGNVRHFSRIWGLQLQNWFEAAPPAPRPRNAPSARRARRRP